MKNFTKTPGTNSIASAVVYGPTHARWHGGRSFRHCHGIGGAAVATGVLGLGSAAITDAQPHPFVPPPAYYEPFPYYGTTPGYYVPR